MKHTKVDPAEALGAVASEFGDKIEDAIMALIGGGGVTLAGRWAMRLGYQQALAQENSRVRKAIKQQPPREVLMRTRLPDRPGQRLTQIEKVREIQRTLFNTFLINGSPLGNCTKQELLTAAEREQAAAEGMIQNVAFYKALAAEMPDGDGTVSATVALETAHAIRIRIYQEG